MKVFSMSQRIYYKDLEPDAELIIKKDLELYNCMLHKAFKICFDRAYKDVTYSETDPRKRNIQKKITCMRCGCWIQTSKD